VRTKYRPKVAYKGEASPRGLQDLGTDGDSYLNRGFAVLSLDGKHAHIEQIEVDEVGRPATLGYQKF